MMRTLVLRSTAVVAAAAGAGLVIWAVVRLLGVELTVGKGADVSQVGPVEVLVVSVLAGLAAGAVHRLLARSPRSVRWWPFVGSTAIAVSMLGPSYLADGAAAVALMCMHLAVGFVLVWGFARWTPQPAWDQWGPRLWH